MTTRDKGITLPAASLYVNVNGIAVGVQVTDVLNDYTVKNAWGYGPGYSAPINPAPLSGVTPANFIVSGQDATALLAAAGGSLIFRAGVGSGGNPNGNVQFINTLGLGGGWNTTHLILGSQAHFWYDAKNRLRIKVNAVAPTADTDGNVVGIDLSNTVAYDPPNLADGAGTTTTINVNGAVLGDIAIASFSLDLQGIMMTAYVSSANTVSLRFQNETGGALDLGAGQIVAKVIKQ